MKSIVSFVLHLVFCTLYFSPTALSIAGDTEIEVKVEWPAIETITSDKIPAGEVVVPTDAMRRLRAFIINVDAKTRIVRVRLAEDDRIVEALMLPHSEFYYHAAPGMLKQFQPGEHVVVRFHEVVSKPM